MIALCGLPTNPVSSRVALLGSLKIYDCGNIEVNQGQAIEHKDMTKDQAGAQLALLTSQILSKVERSKVFVVGGSDEMTLNLIEALNQSSRAKFSVLHVDSSIDVKPKHRRQVDEEAPTFHETNQSYLRRLFHADELRLEKLGRMTFLGVQGHKVTQEEVNMVTDCSAFETKIVYC